VRFKGNGVKYADHAGMRRWAKRLLFLNRREARLLEKQEFCLEAPGDLEGMHVETGVAAAEVGVGHMLIAIADAEVVSEFPIERAVAGKLKERPQIFSTEIFAGHERGGSAEFESEGNMVAAQHQGWAGGKDGGIIPVAAQPTRGAIQFPTQVPTSEQVVRPG